MTIRAKANTPVLPHLLLHSCVSEPTFKKQLPAGLIILYGHNHTYSGNTKRLMDKDCGEKRRVQEFESLRVLEFGNYWWKMLISKDARSTTGKILKILYGLDHT